MADNDVAKLVAQVEAKIDKYEKTMSKVGVLFDRQADLVEKRSKTMTDRVNTQFDLLGSRLGKTLLGGAAVLGIERFVSSIVKTAGDIKDTSDALGIGTDQLQEWGALAAQNGTDQETFNTALEKFTKNLGQAALQGGQALKNFQSLGVNVKGPVTDSFYEFADAVAATKDKQQQVAMVTDAFGKSAAKLTPLFAQGSKAIKEQSEALKAQGLIIQDDNLTKVKDLGDAWTELKRQFQAIGGNVLGGALSGLEDVVGDIKSQEFQTALKNFSTAMGEVAGFVIKMGPYLPQLVAIGGGASLGGRIAGLPGAIVGGGIGGLAESQLADFARPQVDRQIEAKTAQIAKLEKQIAETPEGFSWMPKWLDAMIGTGGTLDSLHAKLAQAKKDLATLQQQKSGAAPKPGVAAPKVGNTDRSGTEDPAAAARALAIAKEELRVNDMLADSAQKRADIERDANLATSDSRRDVIRAQDAALQEQIQGTADYYTVSKEIIEELAKLDIETINDRKKADLAAIDERTAAQIRELDQLRQRETEQFGAPVLSQKQYQDEVAAIRKSGADQAAAIQQQSSDHVVQIQTKENADIKALTEEQTQDKAHAVQLNDTIRGGLEDIGVAALHGFGSAKQALGNFLEQLAEAILKMYVLKPLLGSLLGDQGTSGGGLLGPALSSITGAFSGSSIPSTGGAPAESWFRGYASGTPSATPGWHWVGEKGPELMRLPGGTQVMPNSASMAALHMPSLPKVVAASAPVINVSIPVDARGAQEGVADQIDRKLRAVAPAIVQAAVGQSRSEFSTNFDRTMRDRY